MFCEGNKNIFIAKDKQTYNIPKTKLS